MTRLFRSKSCGVTGFNVSEFNTVTQETNNKDKEEEFQSVSDDNDNDDEDYDDDDKYSREFTKGSNNNNQKIQNQFAILDIVVAALKKSIVTCSVEREDVSSLDISWPTEVRHVSHVTFDRFNGFLGLPSEFQPEVPTRVPSA
ncbi:rho GTPase-activating protein 3-like, partial [Trifolium pratense]